VALVLLKHQMLPCRAQVVPGFGVHHGRNCYGENPPWMEAGKPWAKLLEGTGYLRRTVLSTADGTSWNSLEEYFAGRVCLEEEDIATQSLISRAEGESPRLRRESRGSGRTGLSNR
jgi:hypothetical protein